ncbi:Hypothetical protein D9617_2g055650 [Elsinoe fawcettii]|nr:Hypothetical protein D9617_2g055650 [Elsinoe fawcettii]
MSEIYRVWDAPFSSSLLDLRAETQSLTGGYEIIDTSNLIDELGMLNVLPATIPLLKDSILAMLYTESISIQGGLADSGLTEHLGLDPFCASLLLGVVPSGLMTGTTTNLNIFDFCSFEKDYGERCRFEWRRSQRVDNRTSLKAPPLDMALALGRWYCSMMLRMKLPMENQRDLDLECLPPIGRLNVKYRRVLTYTQTSCVTLLRYLHTRIDTDWTSCLAETIYVLDHCLERTTLHHLLGLKIAFHLSGLCDINRWDNMLQYAIDHRARTPTNSTGNYRRVIPPSPTKSLVSVTLLVPHHHWSTAMKSIREYSQARLVVSIFGEHGDIHQAEALDCCFGSMQQAEGSLPRIKADPDGWTGTSDLLVSFIVPFIAFLSEIGPDVRVALSSLPAGADIPTTDLRKALAVKTIYEAKLPDHDHVWFSDAPLSVSGMTDEIVVPCHDDFDSVQSVSADSSMTTEMRIVRTKTGWLEAESITHTSIWTLRIEDDASAPEELMTEWLSCNRLRAQSETRTLDVDFPCAIKGLDGYVQKESELWRLTLRGIPVEAGWSGGLHQNAFGWLVERDRPLAMSFGHVDLDLQPICPYKSWRRVIGGAVVLTRFMLHERLGGGTAPIWELVLEMVDNMFSQVMKVDASTMSLGETNTVFEFEYLGNPYAHIIPAAVRYDTHSGSVILEALIVLQKDLASINVGSLDEIRPYRDDRRRHHFVI